MISGSTKENRFAENTEGYGLTENFPAQWDSY